MIILHYHSWFLWSGIQDHPGGWFTLGESQEVAGDLIMLEGLLPRWVLRVWQVDAGELAPFHVGLTAGLLEHPHNMAAHFAKKGRAARLLRWKLCAFYDPALKSHAITSPVFYCSRGPARIQIRRGLHHGVNARSHLRSWP